MRPHAAVCSELFQISISSQANMCHFCPVPTHFIAARFIIVHRDLRLHPVGMRPTRLAGPQTLGPVHDSIHDCGFSESTAAFELFLVPLHFAEQIPSQWLRWR